MSDEIVTGFATHAGGVLTVEGGVLRGELILATREVLVGASPGNLEALVERVGARDQYTVAGSPVPLASLGCTHEQAHWTIIERLERPFGGSTFAVGGTNEPPSALASPD